MLQHNMISLAATYIVAIIMRIVLEAIFEDKIEKSEDCVETDADSLEMQIILSC